MKKYFTNQDINSHQSEQYVYNFNTLALLIQYKVMNVDNEILRSALGEMLIYSLNEAQTFIKQNIAKLSTLTPLENLINLNSGSVDYESIIGFANYYGIFDGDNCTKNLINLIGGEELLYNENN